MRRLVTLLVGLCIISAPAAAPASAAEHTRRTPQRLAGTVQDSLGRPVAGAKVSLQAANGKVVAKTRSDAKGRFAFARVNPGYLCGDGNEAIIQTGHEDCGGGGRTSPRS